MACTGLTDIQKSDLTLIWSVHSNSIILDDSDGYQSSLSSSSNNRLSSSVPLDNESFRFISSLTTYFIHILNQCVQEKISIHKDDNNNESSSNDHRQHHRKRKISEIETKYHATLDIFIPFFPQVQDFEVHYHPKHHQRGNNNNLNTIISSILKPNIPHGRHIITIDHASLLHESSTLYHQYSSSVNDNNGVNTNNNNTLIQQYGAFLYHKPQYGLCCINTAIALTLITLCRRSSPMALQLQQQHNNVSSSYISNNTPNISSSLSSINPQSIIINVRFYNVYPTIQIHDVKTSNAYKFITLKGRIIKVYSKKLRLLSADVLCIKCGYHFHHLFKNGRYDLPTKCYAKPSPSSSIQQGQGQRKPKCRGQRFELVRRTAKYIDCQKLKLQQEDNFHYDNNGGGGDSSSSSPRSIDLEVTHDLVDTCHAGDCVKVVGTIHALNTAIASGKTGKKASETSTYTLYMVANSIVNTTADLHDVKNNNRSRAKKKKESSSGGLFFTKDQLKKITKVAHADHMMGSMSVRMAFPFDLLVRSLCPSIIGHDCVKAGILLGLLGGTPPSSSGLEDVKCGLTIRSNIHVLIVGDPGMGKSCLLLASQQVAARSVYVGGNTSSTTGLTVSLSKEAGGEVGIEAGALVLADQGVCCIDEFDKMAKSNQDGLLEAMEQQQISIAKAGAVASLPSRCAVIAAANPKQGKYNLNKTVAENLNIAPPLLSRFDLVFILRDDASLDHDKLVSGNIMRMYSLNGNDKNSKQCQQSQQRQNNTNGVQFHIKTRLPWVAQTQNPLPVDLLRDYISYAREYCKPKLTQDAAAILKNYFLTLRYPENGSCRKDSVPITTRQLEALIRLSQARAKACLREFVLKEDAEDVVELMRESVHQVHMDSNGILDKTRGGVVGVSKRKQKKAFVDILRQRRQTSFTKDDFYSVANQLDFPLNDFWNIVDELRYCDQPEIRKGSDGLYYLL